MLPTSTPKSIQRTPTSKGSLRPTEDLDGLKDEQLDPGEHPEDPDYDIHNLGTM